MGEYWKSTAGTMARCEHAIAPLPKQMEPASAAAAIESGRIVNEHRNLHNEHTQHIKHTN